MKTTVKQPYEVEAFVMVYGERVVKRKAYTSAYSERQAILQAFKGARLPENWGVSAKEIRR